MAKALGRDRGDAFGYTVAVDGTTAVVGTGYGQFDEYADVFVLSGSTWVRQARLTAPDGPQIQDFSRTVAVSGDTVVVGAPQVDGTYHFGSAYVFVRSAGEWSPQAKLTAPDAADGDVFGYAVAVDADTVVIGAKYRDEAGVLNAGAAYVFVRSGSTWTFQAKLVAPTPRPDHTFGSAVGIEGDTVVVGEPTSMSVPGEAYVFFRSGTSWSLQGDLLPSDLHCVRFGCDFGVSVAVDGDTVAVGADGTSGYGTPASGAAYVFVRFGSSWTKQREIAPSDPTSEAFFGDAVDVDGDALLVGARSANAPTVPVAGAAYVFTRSASVWRQRAKLWPPDAEGSQYFGDAVALDGTTAVVGSPRDYNGHGPAAGAAYVFWNRL